MSTQIPTFMRDDIPAQRPELDPDTLVVGSPVFVTEPRRRACRTPEAIACEVVSKARVWIEVKQTGHERPTLWRMRLDTQDEGDRIYSQHNARFRTPEQELFHRAWAEAIDYLNGQGIRFDSGSPWRDDLETIRLARLIWQADHPEHALNLKGLGAKLLANWPDPDARPTY